MKPIIFNSERTEKGGLMSNIVSFSGGKDSTAMLHMMLELGEKIDAVVFFDTGWEFPEMLKHIDEVEKKTGIEIIRLKPEKPFLYWMFEREIKSKKDLPKEGIKKGDIHRIGTGWPSPMRRWCTRIKVDAIEKLAKGYSNPVMCVGFASDETERKKENSKYSKRYPLIEWNITEKEALRYCKDLGYTWGGLYDYFSRVSCFCCPLQGLDELRKLRKHFPSLWSKMLEWDLMRPAHNRGFKGYDAVFDLDARFAFEEKLSSVGVPAKLRKRWSTKWREAVK